MTSENRLRIILFALVAALHAILLFTIAFTMNAAPGDVSESARVMKLVDLAEEEPPEPEAPPVLQNTVEAVAENMIETEEPVNQTLVTAGTLAQNPADEYLPMHRVSVHPKFEEKDILELIVYPPIALRSGIEGRVILELFIDRTGMVRNIIIMREDPPGRGFGEAAVRAFTGFRCEPATANNEPVSVRFRYPLTFRIR
jgi:protein TonB